MVESGSSITLSQYLSITTEDEKQQLLGSLKDTKVIFAGSMHPKFPHVYKKILETFRDFPDSIKVYPDPDHVIEKGSSGVQDINKLISSCSGDNHELLKAIQKATFISDDRLTTLAKKCKYGYKGDQTGMRDNASGIISTLDQGCITYCASSFNTDNCYIKGGEYSDAIDLDTTTKDNMEAGHPKANKLLTSIAKREQDQEKHQGNNVSGSLNYNTLKRWIFYWKKDSVKKRFLKNIKEFMASETHIQ